MMSLPCRNPPRDTRRGLVYVESILSIGLTVALVVVFTAALVQYSKMRRETDARRACVLAANAEIDRIRAGLRPLDVGAEAAPLLLPGRVAVQVSAEPGAGVWSGLTQVRVRARQQVSVDRIVSVELAAYVQQTAPEGRP